jgi:putative acetyltransferase
MIRKVAQEDNKRLAKIIRTVFEEHNAPRAGTVYSDPTTDNLFDLFNKQGSILWVAMLNGEIVGMAGIYPTAGLDKNCAELVKFYLLKDARGIGIGKHLMAKCIQSAKDLGYTKLYLESRPEFSKALSMYEKLGFEHLSHPMGFSGHTSCNIWMIKSLK